MTREMKSDKSIRPGDLEVAAQCMNLAAELDLGWGIVGLHYDFAPLRDFLAGLKKTDAEAPSFAELAAPWDIAGGVLFSQPHVVYSFHLPFPGADKQRRQAGDQRVALHHETMEPPPVAFDKGIPPGATVNLTVTPYRRHIPLRLVLPRSVAPHFVIGRLYVGVEPVLEGAIAGEHFLEQDIDLKRVICDVGMDVTVSVTNRSDEPRPFSATILGHWPRPLFEEQYGVGWRPLGPVGEHSR